MALIKGMIRIMTAAAIAAMVGLLVIPAAFAERGYWGVGGEWLLVMVTFVGSLWFLWGDQA